MVKVITVKTGKGGVCKTTNAIHLAQALTFLSKKTLLVDLDAQKGMSKILARDVALNDEIFSSADYLMSNYDDINDLVHEIEPNMYLMKGHRGLINAVGHLETTAEESYLNILRKKLREDFSEYDYIILDLGYGVGDSLSKLAYIAADLLLAPVSLDNEALEGLSESLDDVEDLRNDGLLNLEGPEILLVPNRFNKIFKSENERINKIMIEGFGEDHVTNYIRENNNIKNAYSEGKTGISFELQLEEDLFNRVARKENIKLKVNENLRNNKKLMKAVEEYTTKYPTSKVEKKAHDDFMKLASTIIEVL